MLNRFTNQLEYEFKVFWVKSALEIFPDLGTGEWNWQQEHSTMTLHVVPASKLLHKIAIPPCSTISFGYLLKITSTKPTWYLLSSCQWFCNWLPAYLFTAVAQLKKNGRGGGLGRGVHESFPPARQIENRNWWLNPLLPKAILNTSPTKKSYRDSLCEAYVHALTEVIFVFKLWPYPRILLVSWLLGHQVFRPVHHSHSVHLVATTRSATCIFHREPSPCTIEFCQSVELC